MCVCVCVCVRRMYVSVALYVSLAYHKTYQYLSITVDHAANTCTWGFIMHLQRNTGRSTDTQRLGLNEEATLLTTEQQRPKPDRSSWKRGIVRTL